MHAFLRSGWGIPSQPHNQMEEFPGGGDSYVMASSHNQTGSTHPPTKKSLIPDNFDISGAIRRVQILDTALEL
jgi:hypothetical protein